MSKIVIRNVSYTNTDETFYVLNSECEISGKYQTDTLEEALMKLQNDGWNKCGKVNRHDYSHVDMLKKDNHYIAVWLEQ